MQVAAIQHDIVWENPEANFELLAPKIAAAAADGAQLIALTEMFSWGFSMNTATVREPIGGPSTRFLIEQAAANDAWVCGSLPAVTTRCIRSPTAANTSTTRPARSP